jgi:hypothetical protein
VRRLNALPAVFGVGDVVFHDRSTGVAVLDGDPGVADVAGLVGADFLSQFDVEFDFAAKMLRLYRETGCDAAAPSWDGAFSRIPFRGEAGRIYVDAVFDGVSTSTLVDTGNPVSFILKSAPALAGVSPQSLVDTGSKIDTPMNGGKTFSVLSHVFDDVAVGDDHFRHVKFAVADIPVSHDMANLGLNYWSRHKMWIAYSHHQIFIDKSSPALAVAGVKTVDAASPTTSSSPAVPGVLSGLSVGQLPSERVVHRAVVKDMATWLVALVALDDNCQVVDSAKIVVTKSPDHGAVATESRPRHSEYPVANPRSKCNAVAVPANVVKYTPNAGFTGEDSVTVEMDLASGTHVVEIFALTVD